MTANAQSVPQAGGGGPAKRRFRNYLLDVRFQLKYTGMVVGVTFVVATILGYMAYEQSRAQTEMMTIEQLATASDPETAAFIAEQATEADTELLLKIVMGILLLTFSLGVTGILVTHKVVGPAYKLKRLFNDLAEGHLRVQGKLRKGDELQDVFLAYESMVNTLRAKQREEITQLEAAIQNAKSANAPESLVRELVELRDNMERELA